MNNISLIPENKEGKQNDIRFSVSLADEDGVRRLFERACLHLATPSTWHELAGPLSAEFTLHDSTGEKTGLDVREGYYIRINIPGTGPKAGKGYDWVKVVALDDRRNSTGNEAFFGMKVQPCHNPLTHDPATAHFFRSKASSTFIISRMANLVVSSYHGRNELPNNDTDRTGDNIRNTIIATGAVMGLSDLQWSALVSAFIRV